MPQKLPQNYTVLGRLRDLQYIFVKRSVASYLYVVWISLKLNITIITEPVNDVRGEGKR